MDVVRAVNDSNLILPAGEVRIGSLDYTIYNNSQLRDIAEINHLPLKTLGAASVTVGDVGAAEDARQIQSNIVRVDGQPSVYLPILKQGGDANTIAVVDGVKNAIAHLFDVPKELVTRVVFDQSQFVRSAIQTLVHEGTIGLFLTSLMILIFLGSMRATVAVFLSIPLSALAAFIVLYFTGGSVNTMVLGGLALAFSRLIDNSVVVLENIFRHLELGEPAREAAERGGREVALPVLAATLTTAVVFFSRHVSVRREPLSVFGARPGSGAFTVCLIRGGHDRGAIVLLEILSDTSAYGGAKRLLWPVQPRL
jgi:multidrug efflux pump subunit AcrB